MHRWFILLLTFLIGWGPAATAQKQLSGLWEGVITKGGLDARDGYKFELYLELEGNRIKGRSYVYLDKGQVIEMDLRGYLYSDRSIYLQESEFIPMEGSKALPDFFRKYQMIFSRSIWENKLEGYWQEVVEQLPLDDRRERGRIFLKKKDSSKA